MTIESTITDLMPTLVTVVVYVAILQLFTRMVRF